MQADTVWQATTLGRALLTSTGYEAYVLEVMPQAEFVTRSESEVLPPLVSVPQAAELLGVSRQAVLDRAQRGTLPGTKVGDTWVLLRSSITIRGGAGPAEVVSYP